MTLKSYNGTRLCCYVGIIVQAVINNLSPILFIIFQNEFGITYSLISTLILINFVTQFVVDILSVKITSIIGYRKSVILSQCLASVGLMLLGILPRLMPSAFAGLVIATMIYAFGSGLIEVLVSPMIEHLPLKHKSSQMSLLHSFYCWGQLLVVLVTTILLKIIGTVNWIYLPILWAVLPFINMIAISRVPIVEPPEENRMPVKVLMKNSVFKVAITLMLCAGAAELAMSQWSSLFAEKSLGVSKVMGDLLGPCMFALFMGIGRTIYGLFGKHLNMRKCLIGCSVLCVASYLITSLSSAPLLSMFGCALCGFSVSLMWPGAVSLSAGHIKNGGTAMFAILAMFGDMGCSAGPFITGVVSDAVDANPAITMNGLNAGLLFGTLFGAVMFFFLIFSKKKFAENSDKLH